MKETRCRRWRSEVMGRMMAVCGRGTCRILSGDKTEGYSIAFAVLGNTPTCTSKHRAGSARLIWLSAPAWPPRGAAIAVGRRPDHFGQYH